jgi:glycosyltransferase involved in cell wall biosynthesis
VDEIGPPTGPVHRSGPERLSLARPRLAFIVSHPIQYVAPLYPRLARREDILIKVFFTWHAGQAAVRDHGFGIPVAWDIPLTKGYEFELVPNSAIDPGTHHFRGLCNPSLVRQVAAWRPNIVHTTGWGWQSHVLALRAFSVRGVPTLFRGDSHLLDESRTGPRWWLKRSILRKVYSWPTGVLFVGAANRAYYEAFGVTPERLFPCPHSIDVKRFAEPAEMLEQRAAEWRRQLGITPGRTVIIYAGKFERKKRPLELMHAIRELAAADITLVMVGSGELETEVRAVAAAEPGRFVVLPFQNQSRMPLVYRLGDLFVLPSAFGETWGLAVNEAMACGRAVLVSDRVGCARDLVDGTTGAVFSWNEPDSLPSTLCELVSDRGRLALMGQTAARRSLKFDISITEETVMQAVNCIGRASVTWSNY